MQWPVGCALAAPRWTARSKAYTQHKALCPARLVLLQCMQHVAYTIQHATYGMHQRTVGHNTQHAACNVLYECGLYALTLGDCCKELQLP
jgi:hypothetical protein